MSKWIAEFDLEDGDTMPEHMDLEYMGARLDFHCRPLEQEPTTRNCSRCKHSKDNHNADTEECHLCMWENQYAPTTKNDLAIFNKIRSEIESKCDRINSLASVLPYTAHREIQELLCEIMDLCKAESER